MMSIQVVSAVVLLLTVTVKAKVSISGMKVTMTCPSDGQWFKGGITENEERNDITHTFTYEEGSKITYHCQYEKDNVVNKYFFYVQGKLCQNCIELDGVVFAVVIIVDVIGTVVVMFIIYRCTKNKSSGGSASSAKTPARAAGRGPPVPSPDYAPLSAHTRSQEPYSEIHRMG